MRQIISGLAIGLAAIVLPASEFGQTVSASGGSSTSQTVALHRRACGATAGPTVGTARFTPDAQGGEQVNPNGMEINSSVSAGLPRASYGVYLLSSPCDFLFRIGTLNTDDSGRGDLDVHVLGSSLPTGTGLLVQLVAPSSATFPGSGPFADVLTSDVATGP